MLYMCVSCATSSVVEIIRYWMKIIVRDLTHLIPKVLNGMKLMGNGISLVSLLLSRGSMEYDRPAIPNIHFIFGENFYFLVWCTS